MLIIFVSTALSVGFSVFLSSALGASFAAVATSKDMAELTHWLTEWRNIIVFCGAGWFSVAVCLHQLLLLAK